MALVECGTGKSRSARLRLVPMHSFLLLSPSSAFSRPLVSLSLSLSFSLGPRPFLFFSRPLDLSLLVFLSRPLRSLAQTHCSAPLRARRFISFLSCLSHFSVHTRTYDTHAPQTKISPLYSLSLSLSFSSSPSIPLVPFSFSDSSLSRTGAHANSRIFPFLSLSPRHPPPLPAPRYSVSLAYARVHIHMCTHARARDRRGYPLRILLSFSRARPNLCANILAHLPRNRTIPPLVLFLDFLLLLVEHAPLTELHLVAAGKASSWHLNRSTHARRATLLRIRPRK